MLNKVLGAIRAGDEPSEARLAIEVVVQAITLMDNLMNAPEVTRERVFTRDQNGDFSRRVYERAVSFNHDGVWIGAGVTVIWYPPNFGTPGYRITLYR